MSGTGQTFSIQEILEAKAEEEWRRQGVPEQDIKFSRLSGMDAGDIRGFREFTARHPGYLIMVRCPKLTARPHYGTFQPKPGYAAKDRFGNPAKSGTSGLLVYHGEVELPDGTKIDREKLFVSDYDLMSVWERNVTGFEKVVVSAKDGRKKGPLSPDATLIIRALNGCMESRCRIQHGCQDDWNSPENPGVKPGDHFAAFNVGAARHFDSPSGLGYYYYDLHLPFPYRGNGQYDASKLQPKLH